ncbi:MAG: class I SAM-dependent methyltransferase [Gammaproteobacteria bacterium]
MYKFSNSFLAKALEHPAWGGFIEPDKELEQERDPNDKYKLARGTDYRPDFSPYHAANPDFAKVAMQIDEVRKNFTYEDQCSAKYYFDIFNTTQLLSPRINKIVDVGVFMGGSASVFAGCIQDKNISLDLVDFGEEYLRITYERIRRTFPDVAKRTRLFLGDLPTYVHKVLQHENNATHLIHHDASHNFYEVVRDLAALSFVKDKVDGLMIQDTHLRGGNIGTGFFVDAALYGVFGKGMPFFELGVKLNASTQPCESSKFGTYFVDSQPEGMYIPFKLATFRYPHPSIKLESILPQAEFAT